MFKLTIKFSEGDYNNNIATEFYPVICKSKKAVFEYIKTYIKSLQEKIGTKYYSVSNNNPVIIDNKIYCSATTYIEGNTPCENYNFYAEKI